MATTTTITKLLFRRGNDADRIQTILASGEPGFALDTGRVWIGDGATPGGIPVIAAADHHLNYVDDTGAIEGNYSRHKLDISVSGLSATFAGDRTEPSYAASPKLLHPADRDIVSQYPLQLTGQNESAEKSSLEFSAPTLTEFSIGRTNDGIINIGGVILINTAEKTLSLQAGGAIQLSSDEIVIADSTSTLFEDKSVDLNVPIVDGATMDPLTPEANAATADETGLYIAHMGYLSAGKMGVKSDKSRKGWNTISLRPPVHDSTWSDSSTDVQSRLQGNVSQIAPMPRLALWGSTSSANLAQDSVAATWLGDTRLDFNNGSAIVGIPYGGAEQYNCKDINIRSVRPGDSTAGAYRTATDIELDGYSDIATRASGQYAWAGPVDVVFETGLIVYGPGDRDLQPSLNGYLINQSLDSMSYPTFQGLRIEGPNANPIGVESGGTGNDSFTLGRALRSSTTGATAPLEEIEAAYGSKNIIGVNHQNYHVGASLNLLPGAWFAAPTQASGDIIITSKFIPNNDTSPHGHHDITNKVKEMYFDKWSSVTGDDSVDAHSLRFDGKLKLTGDVNNVTTSVTPATTPGADAAPIGDTGIYQWNPNGGPMDTVTFTHINHAEEGGAFVKGQQSGDTSTIAPGVTPFPPTGPAAESAGGTGSVIHGITLNKGGHIRNIECKNLDDRFALVANVGTKGKRTTVIHSPGTNGMVNATVEEEYKTTSNSTVNNWLNSAENSTFTAQVINSIEFNDYGTIKNILWNNLGDSVYSRSQMSQILDNLNNQTITDIYAKLEQKFDRTKQTQSTSGISTDWLHEGKVRFSNSTSVGSSIYENSSKFEIGSSKRIRISGNVVDIEGVPGKRNAYFAGANSYFYTNGAHVATINGNGITLQGGYKFHGTATSAELADKVKVQEMDGDTNCPVLYTTTQASGYHSVYSDSDTNSLFYDSLNNKLHSNFFVGDGRHLDMTHNTTIPPSVELQTGSTGTFNVVLCQSDRHKIYDKNNTITVNAATGDLHVAGDIVAYTSFSDKRLKKNITTLDSEQSLNKVLDLSGVSFEWKGAPERGQKIGLIAQEVEEIVPEVVLESHRAGEPDKMYKRVDYEALVPLLIESIKELTSRVQELEAGISE
jgi:hypothetical protein